MAPSWVTLPGLSTLLPIDSNSQQKYKKQDCHIIYIIGMYNPHFVAKAESFNWFL